MTTVLHQHRSPTPNPNVARRFKRGEESIRRGAALAKSGRVGVFRLIGFATAMVTVVVWSSRAANAQGSSYELIHHFAGSPTDGDRPSGALIQSSDGNFYGTTALGGEGGDGTVFQMTAVGDVTILHSFTSARLAEGLNPGGLIQATDGYLYGTAGGGRFCGFGSGCGIVYRIAVDGTNFAVIHTFTNGRADGAYPSGSLIQASDGNLYGTTRGGGPTCFGECGTIFRMAPDGTNFALVHGFGDGWLPNGVVQAIDGNLYGTTNRGGGGSGCSGVGCGTVFSIMLDGTNYSVLHTFSGGTTDGGYPNGGLIQATDGYLYGTTEQGGPECSAGAQGCGTLFRIAPSGDGYTILHAFEGFPTDGVVPSSLLQGTDGNLYGTTNYGGSGSGCVTFFGGCGTIFTVAADGTSYAELHEFAIDDTDGSVPTPLIQAADGSFYGASASGGASNRGVAFRLTLVFTLTASPDTASPGDAITVQWTASPGRSSVDWIGLYGIDSPNTDYVWWWQYTGGATTGGFDLTAPTAPGRYEFRYLVNDSYVDVARSNPVTVTAPTVMLKVSPSRENAGEPRLQSDGRR